MALGKEDEGTGCSKGMTAYPGRLQHRLCRNHYTKTGCELCTLPECSTLPAPQHVVHHTYQEQLALALLTIRVHKRPSKSATLLKLIPCLPYFVFELPLVYSEYEAL